MGNSEDKLGKLEKKVLGNKQNNKEHESIAVFDSETDTSVIVNIDLTNISDDRELEFFFDETVRKIWHKQEEEWYFSIVDVCQVLTDSVDGRKYWNKLKQRLKEEGNETVTNCHQLKMKASDGKMRKTDVANTEQLLRIIQSIPSKNPKGYQETKGTVVEGGTIAGNARRDLEERIGRSVISPLNAQSPNLLDVSDESQEN